MNFFLTMFKKIIILPLILILTNCGPPGTALIGPSITGVRTGSVYQAGISYGSNLVIKKTKEGIKKIKKAKQIAFSRTDRLHKIIRKNQLNKIVLKNEADLFFRAVKDSLKKYN